MGQVPIVIHVIDEVVDVGRLVGGGLFTTFILPLKNVVSVPESSFRMRMAKLTGPT
jgi:hypothetical protein